VRGEAQASLPSPAQAARPPLRVGPGQKFKTVLQAIHSAAPGDRILVQGPEIEEELLLDGKDESRKNLTIEADSDKPVLWRAPAKGKPSCLIALSNVEGLKLRGFTFDGDNRCQQCVILLTGRCPGTALEDVTVQGFTTTTGVLIANCEGSEARPVTLLNVAVTTPADKKADAALAFDLDPQIQPPANRFIQFTDCRLSGVFQDRVRNLDKAGEGVKGLPG
jgi:hypothetical protein